MPLGFIHIVAVAILLAEVVSTLLKVCITLLMSFDSQFDLAYDTWAESLSEEFSRSGWPMACLWRTVWIVKSCRNIQPTVGVTISLGRVPE